VEPGLSATVELTVAAADTAEAIGSGDVPVISTPRVIALCEQAAFKAVDGRLHDGETSVGMRIQLDHVAPTAVGHLVVAEAKLDKIEGRRLCFSVSVNDERGLVAAGRVTRVVVEREHFLKKAE
jgi:predicted thioesterase